MAILAVESFLAGLRVLYATPTAEQIDRFWEECKRALHEPIELGVFYKNETKHIIERSGTEQRIRGKTAWNADTLRGDYADLLILDEYQLMSEDTWQLVGAPMMADTDGNAVFIYTPLSLGSRAKTKARNPRHAAELFIKAKNDDTGRWEEFHFNSFANPHLPPGALRELRQDMTDYAYQQEILALDLDQAPGALWERANLDSHRVTKPPPIETFNKIVVGVDPPGGATECGIVVAGLHERGDAYVLDDYSIKTSPAGWAATVVSCMNHYQANYAVVEVNYGGDMVKNTLNNVPGGDDITIKEVRATRGKAVRAEPVVAKYEQGLVHHVGSLPYLEDELCNWEPYTGMPSPNRLDALVWALTDLIVGKHHPGVQHVPVSGLYGKPSVQRKRPKR